MISNQDITSVFVLIILLVFYLLQLFQKVKLLYLLRSAYYHFTNIFVSYSLIVLDDALASVDNKTAARIINEMRERNNKTILMISHQLSVAATCDRVLVMDQGEIVQEGSHKDLVKEIGLYKQLWERELANSIIKN